MDQYSILDNSPSQAAPRTVSPNRTPLKLEANAQGVAATAVKREAVRFPGEDGGKSLSEMAQRDLDAALQLLAERAQYITGSSGAAIALRQGDTMICCASAGPSAPELGAHLQIDSGLSAESVLTRKILHCDDAENDPRVNQESCRAFGIASVVVMPLVRADEVFGVFELLSSRPHAFEARDFVALERLAEMIQTAVEHAEAARRAEKEIGGKQEPKSTTVATAELKTVTAAGQISENSKTDSEKPGPGPRVKAEVKTVAKASLLAEQAPPATKSALGEIPDAKGDKGDKIDPAPATVPIEFGNVGTCSICGFPVSEGRKLCLDCEAANPDTNPAAETPEFFGQLSGSNSSWLRSHVYLIATVLIVAATIAVLVWRF